MDTAPTAAATPDDLIAAVFSEAGREDPYRFYHQLRRSAPVHLGADGLAYVSTHAGCEAVLRDGRFGAWGGDHIGALRPDWRVHPSYTTLYGGMMTKNPPEHTRLRRLAMALFTPARVARMRAGVEELVGRYLDRLEDAGSDGTAVDFMEHFAFPVPVIVIGDLLGVPEGDHHELRSIVRDWVLVFELRPTPDEVARADRAATRLWAYLGDLVEERRAMPREDLVSAFVRPGQPDMFTAADLLNMLASLYSAGFETTTNLFANGLRALFAHPEQADALRRDPAAVRSATEELLRFDAPIQMSFRVALEDVELDGVALPRGTPVVAMTGAANHDPSVFDAPERLDVRRSPNRQLAFGHGVHHCLGAGLARLEAEVVLPALLGRFPSMAPAGAPTRRPGVALRGFDEMPVTLI
ncbi:cytochrome P450 [Streptomyces sp. NPDC002952]|uniref:cytochrome P450 n=1 Tax=Streptomyces sp. NPDC002952 TaxID=3364673 RepID=UPI0036A1CCE6